MNIVFTLYIPYSSSQIESTSLLELSCLTLPASPPKFYTTCPPLFSNPVSVSIFTKTAICWLADESYLLDFIQSRKQGGVMSTKASLPADPTALQEFEALAGSHGSESGAKADAGMSTCR